MCMCVCVRVRAFACVRACVRECMHACVRLHAATYSAWDWQITTPAAPLILLPSQQITKPAAPLILLPSQQITKPAAPLILLPPGSVCGIHFECQCCSGCQRPILHDVPLHSPGQGSPRERCGGACGCGQARGGCGGSLGEQREGHVPNPLSTNSMLRYCAGNTKKKKIRGYRDSI